nr:unnamed protein product [Spirometra erinaceieuropaei]
MIYADPDIDVTKDSQTVSPPHSHYEGVQVFAERIPHKNLLIGGGILERRVHADPDFLTLLLHLLGDEDHVGGPTMTAEVALAFRQETLYQMVVQAVEKDAIKDLPGDVQQADASVVVAELVITLPLIEIDDCCVIKSCGTYP